MSDKIKRAKPDSRGYTLVELVISISVLGLIAVGIMWAFTNYLSVITRNSVQVDMTTDAQNLLRGTVEELRFGAGVRQTNTITDPNGPAEGWNTGNEKFVIIIAVPATNDDREYIINQSTGAPYNNELVYYKDGTNLYKRTLAHPEAVGNTLKTTCPENASTSECPPDAKLLTTIDDMTFTLYDQDNAITEDALAARSVRIDLSLSKKTFGSPLNLEFSVQTTLRNRFS